MRALASPPLVVRRLRWATGRPQRPALFSTHGARAGTHMRGPARPAYTSLPRIALERHHVVAPPRSNSPKL
eukprot:592159-Alexandrium_andersonii.AAC.1